MSCSPTRATLKKTETIRQNHKHELRLGIEDLMNSMALRPIIPNIMDDYSHNNIDGSSQYTTQ